MRRDLPYSTLRVIGVKVQILIIHGSEFKEKCSVISIQSYFMYEIKRQTIEYNLWIDSTRAARNVALQKTEKHGKVLKIRRIQCGSNLNIVVHYQIYAKYWPCWDLERKTPAAVLMDQKRYLLYKVVGFGRVCALVCARAPEGVNRLLREGQKPLPYHVRRY